MDTDQHLTDRILRKDKRAFRVLVERYERLVKHVVYRIAKNETDREDIAQDVFLKVYQSLSEFRGDSKLSSWIARIAYNTALNHLGKKRVPLLEDQVPDGVTVDGFALDSVSPDTWSSHRDVSRKLHEEIDRLPIQYGMVITLYHLCEMQYEEISQITQQPIGTVKSHLFRARKVLKERLMERYTQEELWQSAT